MYDLESSSYHSAQTYKQFNKHSYLIYILWEEVQMGGIKEMLLESL